MPLLAFASVYLLTVIAALALTTGGPLLWALPVIVFVLVPLAELFLPGSHKNAPAETEAARRANPAFDALLLLAVPVQVGLVLALGWRAESFSAVELAGAVATVGTTCGAIAINVAHELGHRSKKLHQRAAKILLVTTLYHHFFVEHNRGHHARVATPEDPASARLGESLYTFWARSVVGSWWSAWRLEADRLARGGRGAITWDNEVLRGAVLEAGVLTGFTLTFGVVGAAAFVGAALVGILLLETVNYVEHYGLSRDRLADGRFERVRPAHSWTSDRPISRALLFELTRHADHHANPGRPYPALRHFDDAPELPTGYAGMVLLAFFPPLFHAVMNRHLAGERLRLAPAA
ncbi:MAG: Alkane 1-monooxygenase [Pseudomonadota bacterium]